MCLPGALWEGLKSHLCCVERKRWSLNTSIIERVGPCNMDSSNISTCSFSPTDRGSALLSSKQCWALTAQEGRKENRLGCTVPTCIRNKIRHSLILQVTNVYASPNRKPNCIYLYTFREVTSINENRGLFSYITRCEVWLQVQRRFLAQAFILQGIDPFIQKPDKRRL